jgi:hypothetical protein
MHTEEPGASAHRAKEGGAKVFLPAELRGQDFKRVVRAAAALRDLFDDASLGRAVGRSRMAVAGWWKGALAEPETIYRLADVTGLSADEMMAFVHSGGPRPRIVEPLSPASEATLEGIRQGQDDQLPGDPAPPVQSPRRPPRGIP